MKAAKLKERDHYYFFFFHPKAELKFPYLLILFSQYQAIVTNVLAENKMRGFPRVTLSFRFDSSPF